MNAVMNVEYLEPVKRLGRDLRAAAATLSDAEARYLVDAYYTMQEDRIRADHIIRQLTASGEPNLVVKWLAEQADTLETQIRGALDRYTTAHKMGYVMKGVKGIGPVISAGLLAHIDISKAPTVGHIWKFGGVSGHEVWKSGTWFEGAFDQAKNEHGDLLTAFIKVCNTIDTKPLLRLREAGLIDEMPSVEHCKTVVAGMPTTGDLDEIVFNPDNVFGRLEDPVEGYRRLLKGAKLNQSALIKVLSKRPWNARLKTLLWKTGQSFMKTAGGKEPGFYNLLYRHRKIIEIEKNEAGDFASQAKDSLTAKRYRDDTITKKAYQAGKLPAGRIQRRAERYAVKIFLSDIHVIWRWLEFGEQPIRPWVIGSGTHAHWHMSPTFDLVPELAEIMRGMGATPWRLREAGGEADEVVESE